MFKEFKGYIILSIVGILIFLGFYQSNEGLQNIGKFFLWGFTILLFISSIYMKKEKLTKREKISNFKTCQESYHVKV